MTYRITTRLRAALVAFRDPQLVSEGEAIRRTARYLTDRDGMAIIRRDPETEYVVEVLTYQAQSAIRNYLGR